MGRALRIHPDDNVAVAVAELAAGETAAIAAGSVVLRSAIPGGHKFALVPIPAGSPVIKYGHTIGVASADIAPGDHVHLHNVAGRIDRAVSDLPARDESRATLASRGPPARRTFAGYRRSDGRIGIRNEIWVVNTVGCVNQASERIARQAHEMFARPGPGGTTAAIDGVYAFPHPYGCSQLGDDLLHTQKVLAGLIRHPNAAGVLVLGLGCENNQMKSLLEQLGAAHDPARVRYFNAQDVSDEIEEGVGLIAELVHHASNARREPIDGRELIVGMKCGGSDGLSGITANPLVGRVADRLAGCGATVLLTEVPEMFGAEPVLLGRCGDAGTRANVVGLVNGFRDYFRRHGQPIDENPSPGNKDGGITTLAEKSLGCIQKAGVAAPIVDVLAYGQPATPGRGGVMLVNSPGNDAVSCTALTAAGAHVILFTTGRGTPLGVPAAPTLKISSNSALAQRKPTWIDFDAGPLAEGGVDADELADRLFDLVLDVASGTARAQNEINGNREIAIWKDGVTL